MEGASQTLAPADPFRFRGITWLTPHFSLEELTHTDHRGIDNTPSPAIVAVLRDVTAPGMELVRTALGNKVVSVSSGYRCPQLNAAVGSKPTSAHPHGLAVDFNCYGFGRPIDVCRRLVASNVKFDQLIEEGTWVHISFDPQMRNEVLTKDDHSPTGYRAGLPVEPHG